MVTLTGSAEDQHEPGINSRYLYKVSLSVSFANW